LIRQKQRLTILQVLQKKRKKEKTMGGKDMCSVRRKRRKNAFAVGKGRKKKHFRLVRARDEGRPKEGD